MSGNGPIPAHEVGVPSVQAHHCSFREAAVHYGRQLGGDPFPPATLDPRRTVRVWGIARVPPARREGLRLGESGQSSHEIFGVIYVDKPAIVDESGQELFRGNLDGSFGFPGEVVKEEMAGMPQRAFCAQPPEWGRGEQSQSKRMK